VVENFFTVRDFIEVLKQFPPDTPMILSTDAEGNELRMVNGVGARYVMALEHRFMDAIDEDYLDEYDSWVLTTEVW
jgi:hypothetical protein